MPVLLHKSQETAGIHLAKRGVHVANLPAMRVGACLDVSGSMRHEYHDGHVQDALTHLLGLASHMTPSPEMDVFLFHNEAAQCEQPATAQNYENYVRDYILNGKHAHWLWGGTSYSPPIHLAYRHYYPELSHLHTHEAIHAHLSSMGHPLVKAGGFLSKMFHHDAPPAPSAPTGGTAPAATRQPVLMLFLTDGEADDEHEAKMAVHAAAGLPIFWVFVGLAHDSRNLRDLAQEADAEFVLLEDGIRISDDALYSALITPKLANWLNARAGVQS